RPPRRDFFAQPAQPSRSVPAFPFAVAPRLAYPAGYPLLFPLDRSDPLMNRLFRLLALGLPVLLAAGVLAVRAHRADKLEPAAYAIRDARVVLEPGKVLPRATVVVRDGLVEAVGADVKPPADARVIEGKGMTVYPGLVDAMSNWGFDNNL